MTDEARALLIVAALLSGASATTGFVGGRMSVSVPPAEVRYIPIPAPAPLVPPVEAAPVEPAAIAPPEEPAPAAPIEPPAVIAAPVDAKPLPPVRPKIESKTKEQPKPQKSRPPAPKKTLPPCAVVKREYERMSWTEQMAAYRRATAEEVAHGKRCLGF